MNHEVRLKSPTHQLKPLFSFNFNINVHAQTVNRINKSGNPVNADSSMNPMTPFHCKDANPPNCLVIIYKLGHNQSELLNLLSKVSILVDHRLPEDHPAVFEFLTSDRQNFLAFSIYAFVFRGTSQTARN
jgi:hypothetical protein